MKQAARDTQSHTISTTHQPPTLAGRPTSKLHLSVTLSSCADLTISELFTELWILRTHAIDFYPRVLDIRKMIEQRKAPESSNMRDPRKEKVQDKSLRERFQYEGDGEDDSKGNIDELGQYIQAERRSAAENIEKIFGVHDIKPDVLQIPAITTFFPDISSQYEDVAKHAGQDLAGAVELAKIVGAKVVEFVMGRRVERCNQEPMNRDDYKCDFVHAFRWEERLEKALDIIKRYVYPRIKNDLTGKCVRLAAEIEPGFSYVLNSSRAVNKYIQLVKHKELHECVGLNLDIGHLIILANAPREEDRISTADVELWKKHIFHTHISDNIGYHFRDLVPGMIHPLFDGNDDREFERWIRICNEIAEENEGYSGYIALELEGCGRIQWIQRSLLRLGYLIRRVNSVNGETSGT